MSLPVKVPGGTFSAAGNIVVGELLLDLTFRREFRNEYLIVLIEMRYVQTALHLATDPDDFSQRLEGALGLRQLVCSFWPRRPRPALGFRLACAVFGSLALGRQPGRLRARPACA